MRVYLDNCCFNRPFDDQTLLTIRLETEAKLQIQNNIRDGKISLAWSYVLDFENAANPYEERKQEIQRWEKLSDAFTEETSAILSLMNKFVELGLKPLDGLHVACAVALKCEYFLTVDKGILKKGKMIKNMEIISPIDFVIIREAEYES